MVLIRSDGARAHDPWTALADEVPYDPERTYLVGSGEGGYVALATGASLGDRLTAVAATGALGEVYEVSSPDDNLQAVFAYLVK